MRDTIAAEKSLGYYIFIDYKINFIFYYLPHCPVRL